MGSGDLAADLTLGNLAPASAVRALDDHSAHRESAGRAHRRRRMEMESKNENENLVEPIPISDDSQPTHQVDRLA